jgi:ABC-type transport system substrate-binding protein
MVAASWKAVGIPTTGNAVPTRKLFGYHGPLYNPLRLYSQQLNAVLYTWTTSPEPDDSFYWSSLMIVRPGHLSGGNFDGYSNPQVDRLTAQALTTTDETTRIGLYRSIQTYLVQDQPDIFLYWTSHFTLVITSLHGYRANPYHPGVTWNVAQWRLS